MKKTAITAHAVAFAVIVACAPVAALADMSSSEAPFMDGNSKSTGYIGALLGANIPGGNYGSDNTTDFGLTLGAKVSPFLGLGFYGTYYGQGNSGSAFGLPVGTSSNTYNLAGEINGFVSLLHFGADIGAGIHSWSGSEGNLSVGNNNTSLIYGPEAGIDLPIGTAATHLSIGGEVHYLFTNANNAPNNLQALAALKVWL